MSVASNPQNPYHSYVVEASAGGGKTYQLSRRFLCLVSAGADPSAILTVTFTKKAAGEMRSRILADATRLWTDQDEMRSFDHLMEEFHRGAAAGFQRPRPRSAKETGRMILASSQALRISTIDSLFHEWTSKFPFEASEDQDEDSGLVGLPSPFMICDPTDSKKLDARAWQGLCRMILRSLDDDAEGGLHRMLEDVPDGAVHALQTRLAELDKLDTYLWYGERVNPHGQSLFEHVSPGQGQNGAMEEVPKSEDTGKNAERRLVESLAEPLGSIIAEISNAQKRQACREALASRRLAGLIQGGLLTRAYAVSKATIRKAATREALANEILQVEKALRRFANARSIATLNRQGAAQHRLYGLYRDLRDQIKFRQGQVEFRDLAKGCYRLFRGVRGFGARYLITKSIRHVMLDEFQDTSRLQWAIFSEIAEELLSGSGVHDIGDGPPSSMFIVGDAKQSIYGFREADPLVMSDARDALGDRIRQAPLTVSYRTSQVVLDFVNGVFAEGSLRPFPAHRTADQDGRPWVPDCGRVWVAPLCDAGDGASAAQEEAELMATALKEVLSDTYPCPVFDKDTKTYRPLTPGDCAILYRASTHAHVYEQALRRLGIPCQREEERGFFSRCEVSDALALLRFLAMPADLVSLCTVLRSPLGRVSDDELLTLIHETTAQAPRQAHAPTTGDDTLNAHHLARRDLPSSQRCQRLLEALSRSHQDLANQLGRLVARARQTSPHEVLLEGLSSLRAWESYTDPTFYDATDGQLARRNLFRLVELVMEVEDQGSGDLLSVVGELERLSTDDETGNAPSGSDAVTLMTIHKSKGLEFPMVVVVDTGRSWGQVDRYWAKAPGETGEFGVYYVGTKDIHPCADPSFDRVRRSVEDEIVRECERLLYVAVTRARQYLLITGHVPGQKPDLEQCVFHSRLYAAMHDQHSAVQRRSLDSGRWVVEQRSTVTDEAVQAAKKWQPHSTQGNGDGLRIEPCWDLTLPHQIRILAPSGAPHNEESDHRSGLRGRTSELQLLRRPLAAAYGTFVHKALEAWVTDKPKPGKDVWEDILRNQEERLTPEQEESLRKEALQEVETVCQDDQWQRLLRDAVQIRTEQRIVNKVDDRLVDGSIDLVVERGDGTWLVLDYKTAAFHNGRELTDEMLLEFCQDRGYVKQITEYVQAVKAATTAPVAGWVYFTSLRRFVTVCDLDSGG